MLLKELFQINRLLFDLFFHPHQSKFNFYLIIPFFPKIDFVFSNIQFSSAFFSSFPIFSFSHDCLRCNVIISSYTIIFVCYYITHFWARIPIFSLWIGNNSQPHFFAAACLSLKVNITPSSSRLIFLIRRCTLCCVSYQYKIFNQNYLQNNLFLLSILV